MFSFLQRQKQRAATVAESNLSAYRRLIRAAVAKGDLPDPDADKLVALAAELGRDFEKDVEVIREHDRLTALADSEAKLRDELSKASTVASHHREESKRIADERAGQQTRMDGQVMQRRAELSQVTDAAAKLTKLRIENQTLLGVNKQAAYLLPLNQKRDVVDQYEQWTRSLRVQISEAATSDRATALRARIAELEAQRDAELARMDRQAAVIERGNIRAVSVSNANVDGIASELVRSHTFTIAPEQSPAEFNALVKLVESRGKTYANYSEALAAA